MIAVHTVLSRYGLTCSTNGNLGRSGVKILAEPESLFLGSPYFLVEDEIFSASDPAEANTVVPAEFSESSFYYQPNASSAIMRLAHFPDSLLPLLQMEILAAREAVAIFDCSMIVEFGCYDGRALEVARFSGLPYLGIDTDEGAIDQLRERIQEERLDGFANAMVGDALESDLWQKSVIGSRPLHLLPFNLLGNFRSPGRLLGALSKVGGMAMISVFNSNPMVSRIRRDYYTKCGIRELKYSETRDWGALFIGADGFYSRSFDRDALCALIKDAGAVILQSAQNCVGQCVAVLFDGSIVEREGRYWPRTHT